MDEPEAAFWAAIAVDRGDELPILVFADWLDEGGDPRGSCLRWMVAKNKKPAFDRHDTKTWDWWSRTPVDPMHYDNSPLEYVLPLDLFTRLTPFGPGFWKGEPTLVDAIRNLCAAWKACAEDQTDPQGDNRRRAEPDAGLAADGDSGV